MIPLTKKCGAGGLLLLEEGKQVSGHVKYLAPATQLHQEAFVPVLLLPGSYGSSVKCHLWDFLTFEVDLQAWDPPSRLSTNMVVLGLMHRPGEQKFQPTFLGLPYWAHLRPQRTAKRTEPTH